MFDHLHRKLPVDTETQSPKVFSSVPSCDGYKDILGRGFTQYIKDNIPGASLASVTLHVVNSIIPNNATGPAHMAGFTHTAVTNQLFNGFRSILPRFQPDTPDRESAGTGPGSRTFNRCCQCCSPSYLLKKYR